MSDGDPIEPQAGNPDAVAAAPSVFKCDGTRLDVDPAAIQAYNFRSPGSLGQTHLQQLGMMHQKFAQHLSARLSTFLRMECALKIAKFGSMTFAEFAGSINDPAHVTLFQAEPLRGIGILDISVRLALAMADRILGGRGRAQEQARNLTEIELALLEDAVAMVAGEWARLWESEGHALHPQCIGCETSGRFLQTSPPDAAMVVVAIEAMFGENIEQMQIGFPFSMIEPALKKMQGEHRQNEVAPPRQIQWRSPFNAILVPVTAEWLVSELTVRDVIGFQPGQVLELPRALLAQTRVRFADAHEFEGTAGVKSGLVAVQLTKQNRLEQHP